MMVYFNSSKNDVLRHSIKFFENNHCFNRIVTGIEWSPNVNNNWNKKDCRILVR